MEDNCDELSRFLGGRHWTIKILSHARTSVTIPVDGFRVFIHCCATAYRHFRYAVWKNKTFRLSYFLEIDFIRLSIYIQWQLLNACFAVLNVIFIPACCILFSVPLYYMLRSAYLLCNRFILPLVQYTALGYLIVEYSKYK